VYEVNLMNVFVGYRNGLMVPGQSFHQSKVRITPTSLCNIYLCHY